MRGLLEYCWPSWPSCPAFLRFAVWRCDDFSVFDPMGLSWFDPGILSCRLNKEFTSVTGKIRQMYVQRRQKRNVANRDLTVHPMRMPGSIGIASSKPDKSRVGSQGTALCRSEADCKGVRPESRKTLTPNQELSRLTEHLHPFQPKVSGVVAKKSQAVRLSSMVSLSRVLIFNPCIQMCHGLNAMGTL